LPDENPLDDPQSDSPSQGDGPRDPLAASKGDADAARHTTGGYQYTIVDEAGAADPAATIAGPVPRRQFPRSLLVAGIALMAAIIAGVAVWVAASRFGGGGDGRVEPDVSNVLNAFTQSQGQAPVQRFEGELPADFPADVPSYPGSRVVAATRQVMEGDLNYLVIYDTDDERLKVVRYFLEKLAEDPFQIEAGLDGREVSQQQFSRSDDAELSGLVLVAASKDDDLTTIFISLRITSGADDEEPVPFALPDGLGLPAGFPDDVPQYAGATVISTQFQKQPGDRLFSLSAVTKDGVNDVLDFYRDEFEANGWTVEEIDASESALENAEAIEFSDEDEDIAGQVIAGIFGEDGDYTQYDIQLRESTSRGDGN
jgi:hypothetical protein